MLGNTDIKNLVEASKKLDLHLKDFREENIYKF